MSDELPAIVEQGRAELPVNATLPDIVRHLAASGRGDLETFEKLLELQIAWETNEGKKEYFAAAARLEFPAIQRTKKGLNSYYPPYEAIQEIVDPILRREGFTLTFTSGEPNDKGLIPITGKLAHRMGHFETCTLYQPIGAVSKGMNANQAMGSAVSYGERYCAQMMLNLRFVGMDDDAQTFSYITDPEQMAINDLIAECGMDAAAISAFLEWAGAKSISEITRNKYWGAIKQLENKRARLGRSK
jgi:hypothetical protein